MSASEWMVVVLACLAGAVSPGPSLAVVMRHAVVSPQAGLTSAWSHALGVAIYASCAVSGVALIFTLHAWMALLVWGLAGVWLTYLGMLSWRERATAVELTPSHRAAARDGFGMALGNPKVMVFFLALFSVAVPQDVSNLGRVVAVLTAFAIDGLWYSVVTGVFQVTRIREPLRRHASVLARLSAGVLWLFGLAALVRVCATIWAM